MKVGITGTREGMDADQIECVYNLLTEIMVECNNLNIVPEFHHGDCVGVDVQAAIIAKELKYKVIAHPGPARELHLYLCLNLLYQLYQKQLTVNIFFYTMYFTNLIINQEN